MKLHLPFGLRKALLLCMAAMVTPVLSVATGSLMVGSAALWVVSSQPIEAAMEFDFSGMKIKGYHDAPMNTNPYYWDAYIGDGTSEQWNQNDEKSDVTYDTPLWEGTLTSDKELDVNFRKGNDKIGIFMKTDLTFGNMVVNGGNGGYTIHVENRDDLNRAYTFSVKSMSLVNGASVTLWGTHENSLFTVRNGGTLTMDEGTNLRLMGLTNADTKTAWDPSAAIDSKSSSRIHLDFTSVGSISQKGFAPVGITELISSDHAGAVELYGRRFKNTYTDSSGQEVNPGVVYNQIYIQGQNKGAQLKVSGSMTVGSGGIFLASLCSDMSSHGDGTVSGMGYDLDEDQAGGLWMDNGAVLSGGAITLYDGYVNAHNPAIYVKSGDSAVINNDIKNIGGHNYNRTSTSDSRGTKWSDVEVNKLNGVVHIAQFVGGGTITLNGTIEELMGIYARDFSQYDVGTSNKDTHRHSEVKEVGHVVINGNLHVGELWGTVYEVDEDGYEKQADGKPIETRAVLADQFIIGVDKSQNNANQEAGVVDGEKITLSKSSHLVGNAKIIKEGKGTLELFGDMSSGVDSLNTVNGTVNLTGFTGNFDLNEGTVVIGTEGTVLTDMTAAGFGVLQMERDTELKVMVRGKAVADEFVISGLTDGTEVANGSAPLVSGYDKDETGRTIEGGSQLVIHTRDNTAYSSSATINDIKITKMGAGSQTFTNSYDDSAFTHSTEAVEVRGGLLKFTAAVQMTKDVQVGNNKEEAYRDAVLEFSSDTQQQAVDLLTDVKMTDGGTLRIGSIAGELTRVTIKSLQGETPVTFTGDYETGNLELLNAKALIKEKSSLSAGKLVIRNGSELALNSDFAVGGVVSESAADQGAMGNGDHIIRIAQASEVDTVAQEATLTIGAGVNSVDTVFTYGKDGAGRLYLDDGVKLVKTGAGTQVFYNLRVNEVEVQQGVLDLRPGNADEDKTDLGAGKYMAQKVTVGGTLLADGATTSSGELRLGKTTWTAANMDLLLRMGGALHYTIDDPTGGSANAVNAIGYTLNMGSLMLEKMGENTSTEPGLSISDKIDGRIRWNTGSNAPKVQTIVFDDLTDNGAEANLHVQDTILGGDKFGVLVFNKITNFTGLILGDYSGSDANAGLTSGIRIGTISMDENSKNGKAKIYGSNGGGVFTHDEGTRLLGEGKFTINKLTVRENTSLWMNTEGKLQLDSSVLQSGATLVYTGAKYVVEQSLSSLTALASGQKVNLNLQDAKWDDKKMPDLEKPGLYEQKDGLNFATDDISWVDLGFTAVGASVDDEANKQWDTFRERLDFVDMIIPNYIFAWIPEWGGADNKDDKVYHLHIGSYGDLILTNAMWDPAWGQKGLSNAPGKAQLSQREWQSLDAIRKDGNDIEGSYGNTAQDTGFNSWQLALNDVDDNPFVDGSRNEVRLIGLHTQGAITDEKKEAVRKQLEAQQKLVVLGGSIYQDASSIDTVNKNTWISLRQYFDATTEHEYTAKYHILAGGSACIASESNASGAFIGNSHIQVDWGEVDYIVGGNHVTNSDFLFKGSSYISVLNGCVNGSVVGGSTITRGSAVDSENVRDFIGDTHIYIYSAMKQANRPSSTADTVATAADTDVPGMNLGKNNTADAFSAIVGGNAWVSTGGGTGNMGTTFQGNSHITIDLTGYSQIQERDEEGNIVEDKSVLEVEANKGEYQFTKAIVGGNYTVFSESSVSNRQTMFQGNAYISITASNAEGMEDVFTEGVAGAGRRTSPGAGSNIFDGSTQILLNGGIYQRAIAGGFWMEDTATGDHQISITGSTNVIIKSGGFWRVVGGSWSEGGGMGSAISQDGSSSVTIYGGSFSAANMNSEDKAADDAQRNVSFVAGGNFYRNDKGESHVHESNTSVTIDGSLGGEIFFEGTHIVGGDYANSSMPDDGSHNGMVTEIKGTSSVYIKGKPDDGDPVNITGIVVGGSYLTDKSTGGTVRVNATSVTLQDGAILRAEVANDFYHNGIAIVGGNMLIDESEPSGQDTPSIPGMSVPDSGAHTSIVGSTEIALSNGSVYGHVVGGSYVNDTKSAENEITTTGEINIRLGLGNNSLTLEGNVYGGHFSDNKDNPDRLTLGDVNIAVDGAMITGDIVGGSYRAASSDTETFAKQGNISITLQQGTLVGNVYAAGYDGTETKGATVNTQTQSVTVTVHPSFVFESDTNAIPGVDDTNTILISGGYGRAHEEITRGSVGSAKLVFTGSNNSINDSHYNDVLLANFNEVEVRQAGNGIGVAHDLIVLQTADKTFTKSGEGTLSVGGLKWWNEKNTLDTFTGAIYVQNGILAFNGADKHSISGGLKFNLDRSMNNSGARGFELAWLQSVSDTLQKGSSKPVKVDFELGDRTELIPLGYYYLATGLETNLTIDDFDGSDSLARLNAAYTDSHYEFSLLVLQNCLVLWVSENNPFAKWVWNGLPLDEDLAGYGSAYGSSLVDHTWYDDSKINWNKKEEPAATPNSKDVYFDGLPTGTGDVFIHAEVKPRSVWVLSGRYNYVQEDGTTGGLNIGGGDQTDSAEAEVVSGRINRLGHGDLAVGGVTSYTTDGGGAELTLSLANTRIGKAWLMNLGTLTLNHEEAIQSTTEVNFRGGTLAYAKGGEMIDPTNVTASDGAIAKVRTGESALEDYESSVKNPVGEDVAAIWGRASGKNTTATHGGLALALGTGLLKFGVGSLTLDWENVTRGENVYTGSLSVREGLLTLAWSGLEGDSARISPAEEIIIDSGATLQLLSGEKGSLVLASSLTGYNTGSELRCGSLVVGSADMAYTGDGAPIELAASNEDFRGTIKLLGSSSGSQSDWQRDNVLLSHEKALGGLQTTLVFAGRHFAYAQAGDHVLRAGEMQVVDGTRTYVGGVELNDENRHITLKGKITTVAATADAVAENSGVLANAWGTETEGFAHTFDGELDGFAGRLIAGDAYSRPTGAAESSLSQWTLVGNSPGDLHAQLAGGGSFVFDYAKDTRLLGVIGDYLHYNNQTSLVNARTDSRVTIAATGNTATGSLSGNFWLGDVRVGQVDTLFEGDWAGTTLTSGTLTLVHGELTHGLASKGQGKLRVETWSNATGGMHTQVQAGGTLGSLFDHISISPNAQLLGVSGDITAQAGGTQLSLVFGSKNVGDNTLDQTRQMTADGAIYGMIESTGNLVVKDADSLLLGFSNEALLNLLEARAEKDEAGNCKSVWLQVMDAGSIDVQFSYDQLIGRNKGQNTDLLTALGFAVTDVQGGYIELWGGSGSGGSGGNGEPIIDPDKDVYFVIDSENPLSDPHNVSQYDRISSRKATVVDSGFRLSLSMSAGALPTIEKAPESADAYYGGVVVNNLVGLEGSELAVRNIDASEGDSKFSRLKLVLRNTWQPEIRDHEYNEDVHGIDTEFLGSISTQLGVDVQKRGNGRLTIGSSSGTGGLAMTSDGTFTLTGGSLVLQGTANAIGSFVFNYQDSAEALEAAAQAVAEPAAASADKHPGANREELNREGLTLRGVRNVTEIGDIAEDANYLDSAGELRHGGDVHLEEGAELRLIGKRSSLADSTITAQELGGGVLTLAEGTVLELLNAEKQQLSGAHLKLTTGSCLALAEGSVLNSVASLSGGGDLSGTDARLTILAGPRPEGAYYYSGSFSGERSVLFVEKSGSVTFKDATGGSGWELDNYGSMTIDTATATEDMLCGDVHMRAGSTTTIIINTDYSDRKMLSGGTLTVDEGSTLVIESVGVNTLTSNRVVLARLGGETLDPQKADVLLGRAFFRYTKKNLYLDDRAHELILELEKRNDNGFDTPGGSGMEKNPKAGSDLLWDASDSDKNKKWPEIAQDDDSDLKKVVDRVVDLVDEGRHGEKDRILAGVAGASTSVLGMALAEDMHRQLRTTRNRSMGTSVERCWNGATCVPLLHAYIQGEASYDHLKPEGFAPGYTLSSWGGTVGADVDVRRNATEYANIGLALTAMYGDLRVKQPESAKGDMDTQYLTAFARYDKGKWAHTLAMAAGLSQLSFDRTVNFGTGYYTTHGSTEGYSLGALYELGYNLVTSAEGLKCVQLVLNAEGRHVSINGYTETGSDAALRVGDMDYDVLTLGLGSRFRTVMGYNVLNRAATFEARLIAKADLGDRSGKVSNALLNGTDRREEVESARLGIWSIEFGAGASVPCGKCGAFFIDASIEVRDNDYNADVNAGYRMAF